MQRRRTAEDELNMRTVYAEGDLISVSMLYASTAMPLHLQQCLCNCKQPLLPCSCHASVLGCY